ncbi:CatB-related O-acetyltransferase [Terasakiella sp. SH-1]|uniref:CatB-related O-acetyltransferase n=1 Tax=Terasakiella sp. SH-1 TaxID=2560057 RepID=UPI0010742C72|nr:CatB-related O-acetyltransferase [Terasakiella sp. SH-1]
MTESSYERLNKMMDATGWLKENWTLNIDFHDENAFFFTEEGVTSLLKENPQNFPDFFIGRNSYMMPGGMFTAHTLIGRYCSISKDVFLGNSNHHMDCLSTNFAPTSPDYIAPEPKYTTLGCDVWIGANTVILQGVKIGHGAIIGAGSIITKDVPPYAIVVGNPGRIIKYRFEPEIITDLLETKWWSLPHDIIEKLPHHNIKMCIDLIKDIRAI